MGEWLTRLVDLNQRQTEDKYFLESNETDHLFSSKKLSSAILLFHLPNLGDSHIQLLCYYLGLVSKIRSHNHTEHPNYK